MLSTASAIVNRLLWWSAHSQNTFEVNELLEKEKRYNDQLTEIEQHTGVPLDPDSPQYWRATCIAEREYVVRTHSSLDENMRLGMLDVIRGYHINEELAELRDRLAELGALHLSRKRITLEQVQELEKKSI
ncbi:hypothetical protein COCOBI_08-0540 [Coccomyxa sp. Obi]|nr:hypothetical protein COCOBI_08-0540 [Coccomyxa sp. Obi]